MAFGARLQALRRARGLTQEDLAAELNVSRQAVSKWESGRGYPEMEKILYICRRYGVSMDSLFDEEAPAGDPPAEEPAQPPAPQSLGRALGSFVENLSPANRWAGIGSLVGMTALLGLCALYLKGGGSGEMTEMTILWTGAIIVFGVVDWCPSGSCRGPWRGSSPPWRG